jgi:energy-coupling factor transporter ATP-binding protein EcfA2
LIPIDTPDLCRLIAKTTEAEREIEAKNILLFIGETGSGKTTNIKSMLGYKMGTKLYRNIKYITIIENVTDPRVLDMHSNPSSKSVTRYIVAVRPRSDITSKEVYLTDTPGFGDSAGIEVQLANIAGVKRALRRCKTVIPVIVISKESWGPRGTGIKNLARTLSSLFTNYEQCKESIAIVMNRFTSDEMEEMKYKIQNILDEVDPADKVDENYVSFMNHLRDLATQKELLTFNPLKDDPKQFLEKTLLKRLPLKNPGTVFQINNPPGLIIKTYALEIGKRVRYHMEEEDTDLINYFLEDMEKLQNILKEDSLETELINLKEFIEQTLKNKFSKIILEFNSRFMTTVSRRRI